MEAGVLPIVDKVFNVINDTDLAHWVERARLGDRESLGRLAEEAQPKLRAYIYRVVLDADLADDLCQEALLTMIDSLAQLRDPKRFWPWLYRVGTSKIQQHYRSIKRAAEHLAGLEDALLAESARHEEQSEGFGKLVREELSHLVVGAMQRLKDRHRAVLALRCFDELAYEEIGEAMGCSELAARVLFVRAKQSLQKQLSRRGLKRGSLLLVLALFGRATAPAEAAGTTVVTAAATQGAGVAATTLGTLASFKVALVGTLMVTTGLWYVATDRVLARGEVRSVHYTFQARDLCPPPQHSPNGGAFETWCYYPQGVSGPILVRQHRWDRQMTTRQGCWLQDGNANYFYQADIETVTIHNTSVGGFLLLPTDPPDFANFILAMSDMQGGVEYERDAQTTLLRHARDERFSDGEFETHYEYNTRDSEFFERYWPDDTVVWDARDAMHKRGWTYFRVRGQVAGEPVSGRGRIPFVLNASEKNAAWLELQIGEKLHIVDSRHGAMVTAGEDEVTYKMGSFFEGLGRPWMGLTAIDTVRRDAAGRRIRFHTVESDDRQHYEITLSRGSGYAETSVVYVIDAERDVIEGIMLSNYGGGEDRAGMISFEYLEEVDGVEGEFDEPQGTIAGAMSGGKKPGGLWLMDLAAGTFAPQGE